MTLLSIRQSVTPQEGELNGVAEATLGWIDSVHQVSEFPHIPILYYQDLHPFGRYVPGDGRPERIELSLFGPHPHLTLVHEIGHLLDQGLVSYNGYASVDSQSPLGEVMKLTQRSETVQALRRVASSAGQTLLQQIAQRRAIYWLGSEELWARAYAQYIAIRSGSAILQAELNQTKLLETHPASMFVQWEENEFAPIATAIDATFATLGWLL